MTDKISNAATTTPPAFAGTPDALYRECRSLLTPTQREAFEQLGLVSGTRVGELAALFGVSQAPDTVAAATLGESRDALFALVAAANQLATSPKPALRALGLWTSLVQGERLVALARHERHPDVLRVVPQLRSAALLGALRVATTRPQAALPALVPAVLAEAARLLATPEPLQEVTRGRVFAEGLCALWTVQPALAAERLQEILEALEARITAASTLPEVIASAGVLQGFAETVFFLHPQEPIGAQCRAVLEALPELEFTIAETSTLSVDDLRRALFGSEEDGLEGALQLDIVRIG